MEPILELVVCDNYEIEVNEIIRSEGWPDVVVKTYPRMCSHPQKKTPPVESKLRELLHRENVAVLNCQMMQPALKADNFYQVTLCFDLLINQKLVEEVLRRGFYVLTPRWLANWRKNLADWGFDQATARQMFKESITGLALLDSGVDPQSREHLEDMGAYLELSTQVQSVGLDFLKFYINQIVYTWRHQRALQKIESMNAEAHRTIADYSMVIDLLTRLTQFYSEEDINNEITDLFTMLFSQGNILYYPFSDRHLAKVEHHSLALSDQEKLETWLNESSELFCYTPSGKGFWLRISHLNQTLGVLLADNLSLPQYMNKYLNLAMMIAGLCGLSIANAQNFQKLLQAEMVANRESKIAETLRISMIEMAAGLGNKDLLDRILLSLSRVIPYTNALVYLKEDNEMVFRLGLKRTSEGEFENYSPSEKYLRIPITWPTDRVLTREDVEQFPTLKNYVNPNKVQWIGLHLLRQDEVFGLLSISNWDNYAYTAETVELIRVFGSEVSVVLENDRLLNEVTKIAILDGLSGLFNRRHIYELGNLEFKRSKRYKRPLSAVMMDIDHFKRVNDTYGHLVGDQVIQCIAQICLQNKRGADIIGRYGGEEFVFLLPETDCESAVIFAERLRHLISASGVKTSKGPVQVTCSLGVAGMTNECLDLECLLNQCDMALYRAKNLGRNRVFCWEPDSSSDTAETD